MSLDRDKIYFTRLQFLQQYIFSRMSVVDHEIICPELF